MADRNIIFCKLCEIKINFHNKLNIQRHISREKHKEALKLHETGKNILVR